MTTESISLTRALAEVKTLEDRILKAIGQAQFVSIVQGTHDTPVDRTYASKAEVETRILGDMQSIEALTARRAAVKAAITRANVATLVTVGERQMSIAEAVNLKQGLHLQQQLMDSMKTALVLATRGIDGLTKQLDDKVERLVQNSFQNVTKVSEEQFHSVKKPQYEAYEPKLLDPLKLNERIRLLDKHLEDIQLNLDFALSEVNARTSVDIVY